VAVLLAVGTLEARVGRVVAVPLRDAGELPNAEWIGESVAEAIREALVADGVDCVSREEREEAVRALGLAGSGRHSLAAILKLAGKLEARYAVFGDVEVPAPEGGASPARAAVRIRVRLVDLNRLAGVAEFDEQGVLGDLGQIQARLASRVADQLLERKRPAEQQPAAGPVRLDALESYIRGLTSPSAEQKHRLLAQAALLGPDFSAPRLALARMHVAEGGYRAAIRWLEQIAPADPRYREAAFLLGIARYQTGDYLGAVEVFSSLAQTAPSAAIRNNLGLALHRLGDEAAIQAIEQAAAADPTDPDYQFNAGYLLWRRGDLAGACRRFQAALALDPTDAVAQQLLERSIEQQGPRRGDLSSESLERLKLTPADSPGTSAGRRRRGADSPGR